MSEINTDFYKMSLMMVQNIKDASERDIEKQVMEVASMPTFKEINEQTILETIKKIEYVEGITMASATCISEKDEDFKDWLTNERKAECRKYNAIKYSEDYEDYLKETENFPSEVVSRIDEATNTIISKCGDPKDLGNWERRGMVVGSVQSGKTANYVSLINKAADYGYKIIIVIAGIHENLRRQTQNRINTGFIGYDIDTKIWDGVRVGVGKYGRRTYPWAFSSKSYDFDIKAARRSPFALDSKIERPLIFIVKKNPRVLDNLIKWIETAPAKNLSNKIEHPLLLIDDEADNASINTAYQKGAVTKINGQIRKILNQFSNASYVGYTATPFANIFIDPDSEAYSYKYKEKKDEKTETVEEEIISKDLFPRHFIVGLEPPDNYFGPKRLFGNDDPLDGVIEEIFDNENYITLDPKIHTKDYDPDSEAYSYKYKEKKDEKTETVEEKIISKDLFPRHFIVGLEPPDNYFGPKRLFGNDDPLDGVIEEIFDNENYITLDPKIHTKDYDPDIPPSLREAIICFFISDAIKNLRGIFDQKDSSMMINVSRFTKVQGKLKIKIKEIIRSIKNKIETYSGLSPDIQNTELRELKRIFKKYFGHLGYEWKDINNSLIKTYDRIKLKEINQKSTDILKYKDESNPAKSYIVIGGFSLSRGLTLNGLTISYILRNSLMYDTLLQMGRWFGYRNDYEDICKIWMTENMKEDYEHITTSVLELMDEIRQLQKSDRAPIDFGLKVLSHPDSLMITARNKVGKSKIIKTKLDFSGRRIETFSIPRSKKKIISNFNAAEKLIKYCFFENNFSSSDQYKYNGYFFENINYKNVLSFLNNFIATSYSSQLKISDPIVKYISRRQESELKNWDIYIPSPNLEYETRGEFKLKRRKFKIDNIDFVASHRQLREEEDKSSYKLTTKGQVASRTIGKIGLSEEKIRELERQDGKSANSNPKILNCYGRKPLLVIHLYDLIIEKKENKNIVLAEHYKGDIPKDTSIAAWSIIFPQSSIEEEESEYRVNDIWSRQFSLEEIELSETEKNDDSDFFD